MLSTGEEIMKKEYDYIIVGAGTSGLVLAKELSKKNKRVLILERGAFINRMGSVWDALWFYDNHAFTKSMQGVFIYRVLGVGGTSIVNLGNAVEFTSEEYSRIGIDLMKYLPGAREECCVKDSGPIGRVSLKIMETANTLGYDMRSMPKLHIKKCISCGNCVVGCKYESKWTSVECLREMNKQNTDLITGFIVKKVVVKGGKAVGIEGRDRNFKNQKFFANKIILSAGGMGTPVILQNSDVEAGGGLFVDYFNATYGVSKGFNQQKELPMSVVCDKFHKTDGFIMSLFVDNCASFIAGTKFRNLLNIARLPRLIGIETKIADDRIGRVYVNGCIDKEPTKNDLDRIKKGNDISKEILIKFGVDPKSIFTTRPKGAHPGGTAAIGRVVDKNLETKIKNLYVCDASIFPFAPGLPPILTLVALAKWFGNKN